MYDTEPSRFSPRWKRAYLLMCHRTPPPQSISTQAAKERSLEKKADHPSTTHIHTNERSVIIPSPSSSGSLRVYVCMYVCKAPALGERAPVPPPPSTQSERIPTRCRMGGWMDAAAATCSLPTGRSVRRVLDLTWGGFPSPFFPKLLLLFKPGQTTCSTRGHGFLLLLHRMISPQYPQGRRGIDNRGQTLFVQLAESGMLKFLLPRLPCLRKMPWSNNTHFR